MYLQITGATYSLRHLHDRCTARWQMWTNTPSTHNSHNSSALWPFTGGLPWLWLVQKQKKREEKNKHLRSLTATKLLGKIPFKLNWVQAAFQYHTVGPPHRRTTPLLSRQHTLEFSFSPHRNNHSVGGVMWRQALLAWKNYENIWKWPRQTWQHLSVISCERTHGSGL